MPSIPQPGIVSVPFGKNTHHLYGFLFQNEPTVKLLTHCNRVPQVLGDQMDRDSLLEEPDGIAVSEVMEGQMLIGVVRPDCLTGPAYYFAEALKYFQPPPLEGGVGTIHSWLSS